MRKIKDKLKIVKYYLEILWCKLALFFGVEKDTGPIPEGPYCYTFDEERNKKEPIDGYWIKTCKYYRSTKTTGGIACTYVGYFGFDFGLYDQCKICGVKK